MSVAFHKRSSSRKHLQLGLYMKAACRSRRKAIRPTSTRVCHSRKAFNASADEGTIRPYRAKVRCAPCDAQPLAATSSSRTDPPSTQKKYPRVSASHAHTVTRIRKSTTETDACSHHDYPYQAPISSTRPAMKMARTASGWRAQIAPCVSPLPIATNLLRGREASLRNKEVQVILSILYTGFHPDTIFEDLHICLALHMLVAPPASTPPCRLKLSSGHLRPSIRQRPAPSY